MISSFDSAQFKFRVLSHHLETEVKRVHETSRSELTAVAQAVSSAYFTIGEFSGIENIVLKKMYDILGPQNIFVVHYYPFCIAFLNNLCNEPTEI